MENSRRPSEAFDCHNTAGKKEVCERFKYAVSACLPRAPGCTFDVVGARLSPGSRFRTNGYGRAQDAESKSDVRSPETWLPEAARRQRPVMCRDVGGPRCDEYGSRRRIPGGAPNPFPASRRRLPDSAGEPRPAPSPQARCLGGTRVVARLADVSGQRFRGGQKEPVRSAQNTGRSKAH